MVADQMPAIAGAINNATVYITINTGPQSTTYHLTGQRRAVDEKVSRLLREFDPCAYGTKVEHTDFGAVVTRANSAE